jgi:hypothetical protein
MDWCAAKILLEMKYAALLKRLKTTALDPRGLQAKFFLKIKITVYHHYHNYCSLIIIIAIAMQD